MQPDPQLLDALTLAQRGCLVFAFMIALEALAAWWLPGVQRIMPPWILMKPESAVLVLCSALSLIFSERRRPPALQFISRYLAVLVAVVGTGTLLQYLFHVSFGLDTLLPLLPGRMPSETAGMFALLGVVMLLVWRRRGPLAMLIDLCLSVLCLLDLILASGYLFGASQLFGLPHANVTTPETLLAVVLLTMVAFGRRTESGVFVILVGSGIGSKAARIAFPIILVMPFLLELARDRSLRAGRMSPQYAAAIATSMAAMLALALVLGMAWRIEGLERDVRDLSLRDALTGLYNRRGLYLFAEQALNIARRTREPLAVLFIDLDNLKKINDSLGHEMGSRFLCEVGELLKESFRKTDILGRVGGDEFVVVGQSSEETMHVAVHRLQRAAAERDAEPNRQYPFCFSVGFATTLPDTFESLEDLVARADRNMYETKRRRKLARA